MSLINTAAREINCKIVFYGPALSGKTANLQYIRTKMTPEVAADKKAPVVAPNQETDTYFDYRSLVLGELRGFKTKFKLYTVPGHSLFDQSRKLILKAVDGIVFVADSRSERMEANLKSLENLRADLALEGRSLEAVPCVLQYNKRDLEPAASLEEMRRLLNPRGVPDFEATAITGVGVLDTLTKVAKLVVQELKANADAGLGGPGASAIARRGPAP